MSTSSCVAMGVAIDVFDEPAAVSIAASSEGFGSASLILVAALNEAKVCIAPQSTGRGALDWLSEPRPVPPDGP
jgi:hypothetical protein